jgi:hypothetical protein
MLRAFRNAENPAPVGGAGFPVELEVERQFEQPKSKSQPGCCQPFAWYAAVQKARRGWGQHRVKETAMRERWPSGQPHRSS